MSFRSDPRVSSVRGVLLAQRAIRVPDGELTPLQLPPGTPMLALDDVGRKAAARRCELARAGVLDGELGWRLRGAREP